MSSRRSGSRPTQEAGLARCGKNVLVARTLLAVILSLTVLHGPAIARTYRWVDEQGEVHVTDDLNSIPESRRPRDGQTTPTAKSPAPTTAPGSADAGGRHAPPGSGVALWVRTGGLRGEQEPVLIRVYESEEACVAERDRRTAVHVSQGMTRTSQPGLAISNLGGTVTGAGYFAYRCVPAGIRPP